MLRFLYMIVRNIFIIPGVIKTMRRMIADENCSEEERYQYLQYIVGIMNRSLRRGKPSARGRLCDVPESSGKI